MYRNICMIAKTENGEFKNVRALVNMAELEKEYTSFSTFANDYAKANGYQECTVTGFGKCFTENEIDQEKVYEIGKEREHTMTERQIENRVKKLRQIESQRKALEEQEKALKAEIKADMESKGTDELRTKNFIIRWKEIISNNLDSKALKAAFPDVYVKFTKQSISKRFTIA